ncbi:MAG: hypothetical protein P4L46_07095 [Fimbriimonas sp.]|nr:hypothetical protein [Fimbriimonas sp.]
MRLTKFCPAMFLAVLGATAPSQTAPAKNLHDYITKVKPWDAVASGPLMAVEWDSVNPDDGVPLGLAAYERKPFKAGGLTVLAPDRTIDFTDDDLPSAYDMLTTDEKIGFLLATLSPSDLQKMSARGISANELRGEQRAALLSILPKPVMYMQGQIEKIHGFSSREMPKPVPDDQLGNVRLQVSRGLSILYSAVNEGNGVSASNLNSLDYRGPSGTTVVHSGMMGRRFAGALSGRVVDNFERKGDLAWTDPRLDAQIDLTGPTQLGALVTLVRRQTGVEIYADARICDLVVGFIGAHARAGDILHGLCLAVTGAIRRVGSIYLLTWSKDGEASREVRLTARKALADAQIRGNVIQWMASVSSRRALDSVGFPEPDLAGVQGISSDRVSSDTSEFHSGWVELSALPDGVRELVKMDSEARTVNRGGVPIDSLQGKVRLTPTYGYRLMLPDGRPLEFHPLQLPLHQQVNVPKSAGTSKPLEFAKMPAGSAVGLRSDEPGVVADFCEKLKSYGISEMWLESRRRTAIQSAIDAGIKVDLVIRPWRLLPGERCPDIDRNVVGQTGSQLNVVPEARCDPSSKETWSFGDSCSPTDVGLTEHLRRVIDLVPPKGLNRIVVLDAMPPGYREPLASGMFVGAPSSFVIEGPVHASLMQATPLLGEFGYTLALRIGFIRKHGMDPIDLLQTNRVGLCPPAPFFDRAPFRNPFEGGYFYPNTSGTPPSLFHEWLTVRYEAVKIAYRSLMDALTGTAVPLYAEYQVPPKYMMGSYRSVSVIPYQAVQPEKFPSAGSVLDQTINSLNAEDEQGALNYPIPQDFQIARCFDLGDVPVRRVPTYLRYLFRPAATK